MLEGPSNYRKEVGGKTWIISQPPLRMNFFLKNFAQRGLENKWLTYRKSVNIEIVDIKGNVIKTCASIAALMEFLDMSRYMGPPASWKD